MNEVLHLINEMSPYLLLGFLCAGILHAFVPSHLWAKYLSGQNIRSVFYAAALGVPLPLCSCGVIPTAMSLRREGASKGATACFLIATPQTGIDSILATYGLMGLPFAIVRPIAALITSIFGGVLVNVMESTDGKNVASYTAVQQVDRRPVGFWNRCREALSYGFVEMMADIGKWLVVGLVVAGLITVFIPESVFEIFKGNTLASMLLVLCIALPMYVCATGSIPIAVALMMKGLTPGAALVLLMAGPAANFASMLVVRKVMGTRTLFVYLTSIVLGAIGFGVLVDYLQFNGFVDFMANLTQQQVCCTPHVTPWWAWACTVLLLLLLFYALVVRRYFLQRECSCHCQQDGISETNQNINTMKVYHVQGMNCNHCRMSAEKALQGVEGVTAVSVDLATKEARVEGTATREALAQALDAVGFTLTD